MILIPVVLESMMNFTFVLFLIFCFFYWVSSFTENHLNIVPNIIRTINIFVTICTLTNFIEYPIWISTLTTAASLFWTFVCFNNFPKLLRERRDYVYALAATALSHFAWMYFYFTEHYPVKFIVTTFVVFVWLNPLLVIATFVRYDERKKGAFIGLWKSMYAAMQAEVHYDMARQAKKNRTA